MHQDRRRSNGDGRNWHKTSPGRRLVCDDLEIEHGWQRSAFSDVSQCQCPLIEVEQP